MSAKLTPDNCTSCAKTASNQRYSRPRTSQNASVFPRASEPKPSAALADHRIEPHVAPLSAIGEQIPLRGPADPLPLPIVDALERSAAPARARLDEDERPRARSRAHLPNPVNLPAARTKVARQHPRPLAARARLRDPETLGLTFLSGSPGETAKTRGRRDLHPRLA